MRVEPDAERAAEDEEHLDGLVTGCLTAAGCAEESWRPQDLRYPGLHAAAHRLQRKRGKPSDPAEREQDERLVRGVVARARSSAERARATAATAGWAVDLAPPAEDHLTASVRRALRQIPERADRAGAGPAAEVGDWSAEQRAVFADCRRVLERAWPSMLAELGVTLRQVAVLNGEGIDGFTDFTVHGTAFVNHRRLTDDHESGLPGPVRLAEALVHEGTHNRCNSAAAGTPFLRPSDADVLLHTPLRADPRPLAGLFQQVVVLARLVLLYRRLPDGPPVRARHAVLLDQGRDGAASLRRHADGLTPAGGELLRQAEAVLAGGAAV
ncbi:HEXXH motif-containing putative peptide modification protein [Kitasatospora sp. NPDC056651]|uniref:aKG-HExxH-type peptide beta-hydroxylase n=1 Tax=Kitasatospora sp. NPDC056651 TaxID=3345892 RepID=UPI0036AA5449